METIVDYLKRNLRATGPKLWPLVAAEVNANLPESDRVPESFLRKLAYGDRDNPGVKNVQPLLDYFQAVDRGERTLPALPEPEARAA